MPRPLRLLCPAILLALAVACRSVPTDGAAAPGCPESQAMARITALASVDQPDAQGRSALLQAVIDGFPSAVKSLLDRGADPDLADKQGITPLMAAVLNRDNVVLDLLLRKHAAVNARRSDGWTALMMAAWEGDSECIGTLLRHGADLRMKNLDQETVWTKLGQRGSKGLQRWVVKQGALPGPMFLNRPPQPVPPATPPQRWALATTALVTQANGDPQGSLRFAPPGEVNFERDRLARWWNIHDRKSALAAIQRVRTSGHHAEFLQAGAQLDQFTKAQVDQYLSSSGLDATTKAKIVFVKDNRVRLGRRGIIGWDLSRCIALATWSCKAGYLSEKEAWDQIMPIAAQIQATFRSWRDLAENYLAGREFWLGTREEDMTAVAALLLDPKDPRSPYNSSPWDLDLNGRYAPYPAEGREIVPKFSRPTAEELYRDAEGGCAWAQYQLARRYESGVGVAEDGNAVMQWHERASEQGYVWSQEIAGRAFMENAELRDPTKAFRWNTAAAQQGNTYALFNLSRQYQESIGTAKDLPKSLSLLRTALAAGHTWSAFVLAQFEVTGVSQGTGDEAKLMPILLQSDDVDLLTTAADAYQNGHSLPKSEAKARALLERAAALQSVWAMPRAAEMEEYGSGGAVDRALATRWYDRLLGPKGSFQWGGTPAQITRVKGPIALDGTLRPLQAGNPLLLGCGDASRVLYQPCSSPTEMSADVRMLVDDRYLYLGAEVRLGRAPRNNRSGEQLWNGDSVEFWISTAPSLWDRSRPTRTRWDRSVFMAPTSASRAPEILVSGRGVKGVTFKSTSDTNRYTVTAAIPLAVLDGLKPEPGSRLRFDVDVEIAGDNGDRIKKVFWNANDDDVNDPGQWGVAEIR